MAFVADFDSDGSALPVRAPVFGPSLLRAAATSAIATSMAIVVVLSMRYGADWPAQDFRSWIAQHGLSVWTNNWYGGTALTGYSVLFPLFASVLGSSAVGVIAVAGIAWSASLFSPQDGIVRMIAFSAAVVLMPLECLMIGQVTFLLGSAFGLAALVAMRSNKRLICGLLAALCSLSSPLAGLFVLFALVAALRTVGRAQALPLLTAIVGSGVALVVDSGGGPFTYRPETLGAISVFCGLAPLLTDSADRWLRDFALTYWVVAVASFLIENPVGANLNRLGKVVAFPLAVFYIATRVTRSPMASWRRAGVAVGAVLALWWSLIPAYTAYHYGVDDPGRSVSYYTGLVQFLATQDPADGRLEVPFTRTHTEAYRIGRTFPLARGWERQVDLEENDVLYHPLTADSYRTWLDTNAVALVALPNLESDIGGKHEAALLRRPPPYLTPAWSDRNWRVWRIKGPTPIADGAARLTRLGQSSIHLRFSRAGSSLVRVRSSPMWMVDGASVRNTALARSPDGWLIVTSPAQGTVVLRARLNWSLLNPRDSLR